MLGAYLHEFNHSLAVFTVTKDDTGQDDGVVITVFYTPDWKHGEMWWFAHILYSNPSTLLLATQEGGKMFKPFGAEGGIQSQPGVG